MGSRRKIWDFCVRRKKQLLLLLIIAAALFPFTVTSEYIRSVAIKILIMMIFATGLNITNGYSDMFNLGVSMFMCVGAYTTAILEKNMGGSIPFFPMLLITCFATVLIGLVVLLPTFKLNGMFFSIVTMGIAETIRVIALNWNSLTNGAIGIAAIPFPTIFGFKIKESIHFYYLALILLVLSLIAVRRVINSRIGTAWISIRENSDAAASLGINVSLYKSLNFMCSAFICGIGGCLYAFYYRFVAPGSFAIGKGHEVLAMVVLGGSGTLVGPLLGALVINIFTEALRFASEFRMVFYGVLILIVMWCRPQGLVGKGSGVITEKLQRFRRGGDKQKRNAGKGAR